MFFKFFLYSFADWKNLVIFAIGYNIFMRTIVI